MKFRLYRSLIILVSIFFPLGIVSQLDNSSLFYNTEIDTSHTEEVFVKIQNLNYMKNNEYSGGIADGFTLFGVQLNPQLGYQITKNLSIEGGIFLNKDFGNKKFTVVEPTFSLRYYKKDFKMVFGNIDGSVNHQLIEPIYNFERVFTNRLENGVQFVINKKYADVDLWVDWLNMAYRGGSLQEKILGGITTNVVKLKKGAVEFKLPLQATVIHKGGQLDTLQIGSQTDINAAAGIILNYEFEGVFLKSIYADTRYVRRIDSYFDSISTSSWGDGVLANIGVKAAYQSNLVLSYWYCDNFYNELGGFLYSSKSSRLVYPNYSERIRQLLFLRLTKKIDLAKGITLTLRAEPYWDFKWNWMEYSYGFYISIDERLWFRKR